MVRRASASKVGSCLRYACNRRHAGSLSAGCLHPISGGRGSARVRTLSEEILGTYPLLEACARAEHPGCAFFVRVRHDILVLDGDGDPSKAGASETDVIVGEMRARGLHPVVLDSGNPRQLG